MMTMKMSLIRIFFICIFIYHVKVYFNMVNIYVHQISI